MNKALIAALALATMMVANAGTPLCAQRQAPIMELHTTLYEQSGDNHSFTISFGATEDTYLDIDFGYGPTEYKIGQAEFNMETGGIKGTEISGKVSPEGMVRVYGDPLKIDYLNIEGIYADELELSQLVNLDILNLSHNLLKELDLSPQKGLEVLYVDDNPFDRKPFLLGPDHPYLTILSLDNVGSLDQSFKLTDYPKMQSFTAWHTLDLFECDPTKCPDLKQLSVDSTNVSELDVSQNPELLILNFSTSRVSEIDLSNNLKLQQLYCDHNGYLNGQYKLRTLDLSMLENLQILFAGGNLLTELDLQGCPLIWHLSVNNNYLPSIDFSGNPALYNVDISNNCMDFVTLPAVSNNFGEYYYYQRPIAMDRSYPAGTTMDFAARMNRPGSITVGKLLCNEEELGNEYYSYSDGIIEFYKSTPDSVCIEFSNSDFELYTLRTDKFIIKEVADFGKDNAMATWRLKPSAKEISISVGIAGASPEKPVRFSVDLGDGQIQDYTATSDLLPESPMLVTGKRGNSAMTLYIPEGEDLTALAITDTPLSTLNVTEAHSLRHLDLHGCALADIDLRWNHKLYTVNLNGNALETLDLSGHDETWSKNVLSQIYANNNKLTSVVPANRDYLEVLELADNELSEFSLLKLNNLRRLDLSGNHLTEANLQDLEALTDLNLSDNDLASLYIPDYTPLEKLDISYNRFPMSTLPLTDMAGYAYAPQKPWMLPEKAPSVNLSSQEMTADGHKTVFTWYSAADNRPLTPAEITANGAKFKFNDVSVGEVYATWTNEAFPDFTGDNVYRSRTMLVADAPTHVVASFTTDEAGASELTMRSATPGNYVYIDWAGDGNLEQYALDSDTYTRFPVETYANADVKVYTYDDRDGITVFSIDNVPMRNLDLSNMTDVFSLGLDNNSLTADNIQLPATALTQLSLSGNPISGLDLSAYTELYSLRVQDCGLTEFDTSGFPKLGNFVIDGNSLKSLTLDNPELWNLFATGCDLESIDLSKVPMLQQAYLGNNKLSTIDVSMLPMLKVLSLHTNCFTLTTLPRVLSTYSSYEYANQALYPVTVQDGCRIDLSDQLMVGVNRTNYRWFRDRNVGYLEDGTIAGDELAEGTEYTESDGVFTFNVQVKDAVCVMTNVAFPGLIFLSQPTDILGSGVENISGDLAFSVYAANGEVSVSGADGVVSLYAADGRLAATAVATEGAARFCSVASGIYIVTNGSRTAKVLVR